VVVKKADRLEVVYHRWDRGLPYTQFTVEISDYHKKHGLRNLMVDQTGLGEPIVEHVKELVCQWKA